MADDAYTDAHAMVPTHTPGQVRGLWATVLVAPIASLGDLQAGYTLALFACTRGLPLLPLASTVVAIVCVAAALWYAHGFEGLRPAQARGVDVGDTQPASNGWIALVAIGLNLMALLVILAMAVPRLVLDPCWR